MVPHGLLVQGILLVHEEAVEDVIIREIPRSDTKCFYTDGVNRVKAHGVIHEDKIVSTLAFRMAHSVKSSHNDDEVMGICRPEGNILNTLLKVFLDVIRMLF